MKSSPDPSKLPDGGLRSLLSEIEVLRSIPFSKRSAILIEKKFFLQKPTYFNKDADNAINYEARGTVIWHEMTNGFDDLAGNTTSSAT